MNDNKLNRENKSKTIIKKYTLLSGAAALVPYDFVDIISSTVAQTLMVKELCALYQVPFNEKWINVACWNALGSAVLMAITGVVESILHGDSPSDSFDFSGAAITSIYTATLGEFYNLHLQLGGSLKDVEISNFVEFFMAEIKRGDISLATITNPKSLMSHLQLV